MLQTNFAEKTKTYVLCSEFFFFRKSCRSCDNVEKCGTAGQATDDNTIRCMCFVCRINMATDTHTQNMQYLLLFHGNNGNSPSC